MELNTIKLILKKPELIFFWLGKKGLLGWMSDEAFLKISYRLSMKRKLNLKEPKTYNEKLQWLKLHDRNPQYSRMVDKHDAKLYIAQRVGEQYIVPTLGVWDSFDQIDFGSLPEQFVLKTVHDCGGVVICHDKQKLDKAEAKRFLEQHQKTNYYIYQREWPYKGVKPRILAEEYMKDAATGELRDYKFFCFDGEPKALFIASERQAAGETKFDFFDMDFNHMDVRNGHPNAAVPPAKPACFEEMKKLAAKLSAGIPHLRVDFYEMNGKLYVGELTFYHWSGLVPFEPEHWDETFGSWITLRSNA